MAQRQKGQKVYTSMQGKKVDMDLLRKKNELTPAVGNARVNARGDELGPGGKIIKKREDVVKEYYSNASRPVADEPNYVNDKTSAPVMQEEAVVKKASSRKTTRAQQKVEETTLSEAEKELFEDLNDEWVEDDSGNFVKKGE